VISDHPIAQGVIDRAVAASKAFFDLPEAVKDKYHDAEGGRQRGYTPFGTENAKGNAAADQKEFWHTGRDLADDSPYRATMKDTPAVPEVAEFDAATRDFYAAMDAFGAQLLRAVALHLGLPESWFDDKVENGNSILRLLHYPPQKNPPPQGTVRAGAHEDINTITLLIGAEEAGLELLDKQGNWRAVTPKPGELAVNIGDMLQRLTNNRLPSTTHRVVNPAPERRGFSRYSMPFFLHFRPDYAIETLPSCIGDAHPDLYPEPITAHDYLMQRLREIGLA